MWNIASQVSSPPSNSLFLCQAVNYVLNAAQFVQYVMAAEAANFRFTGESKKIVKTFLLKYFLPTVANLEI